MSPEEDRTHDTVDSEPMHYQLSYSGPHTSYKNSMMMTITVMIKRGAGRTGSDDDNANDDEEEDNNSK